MHRTLFSSSALVLSSLLALAGCEERASWVDGDLAREVGGRAIPALAENATATAAGSADAAPEPEEVLADGVVDGAGADRAQADREPEPAEPEVDRDAPLRVKRLVVAEGVEDREPVAAAEAFPAGSKRIYAFVEIGNEERAHSEIFVSITPQGEAERGRIRLKIGASPRWRTWAFTRLAQEPGIYDVVVRDAKGEEIGRTQFAVEDPGAPMPTAAASRRGQPLI